MNAFLTVVEEGSISRAAEKLNIVQPALSRQLRSMEDTLGIKLLERHGRGVSPTPTGRLMVGYARSMLQMAAEAEAALSVAEGEITGHVSIALLPIVERAIAGSVLAKYHEHYPQVTLAIRSGYSGHIEEWLRQGEVDLALLYSPRPGKDLSLSPLLTEKLYLIGPPTGSFSESEPLPLAQLAELPFVLPSREHGLRKRLEEILRREGVSLNVVMEVDGMHSQVDLVMRGVGHAILPLVAVAEEVKDGRLTGTPIIDPEIHQELVVATSVNRPLTPAAKQLIELLQIRIREMCDVGLWPGRLDEDG